MYVLLYSPPRTLPRSANGHQNCPGVPAPRRFGDSVSTTVPQRQDGCEVQNACDDRLDPREFEELVRGAISLDPAHSIESEMAVMLSGRLGMRAGEIAHITEEWVDWRDEMIYVPRHQPCQKGSDGGVCGYCRQLSRSMIERDDDLELGDVPLDSVMWQPKTESGARSIPFGHDTRTKITMQRFFETFDGWSKSRTGVNRKVERAAMNARVVDPDDVYPHALRATAATNLASDLRAIELQSMFGWQKIDTARKYVRISGERLRSSLG